MLRRVATVLAIAGLSLTLIGAGVGAVFTDQATVAQTVSVGTFGFELSTTTPGAVVSPDKHSITFTAADIMSSAPGSRPMDFTVKSIGTIPIKVHVAVSPTLGGHWSSILADPVADVVLNLDETHTYSAGIQWVELTNGDLGAHPQITYTVTGSEV
jgi:predicted ribosomally synthesized peptide with SipW-like signal peptide